MSKKQTEWVVDGAIIGKGSNILSSVELPLLPAAKIANMKNVSLSIGEDQEKLGGIGSETTTPGTVKFLFFTLGEKYLVIFNTVPGTTAPIISHNYLDSMGLKYQTYHKVIDLPEDVSNAKVEKRNYLPFLFSPNYSYLTTYELLNIHRNWGHSSVEKKCNSSNLRILKSYLWTREETRRHFEKVSILPTQTRKTEKVFRFQFVVK